jgi:hypothetical protein
MEPALDFQVGSWEREENCRSLGFARDDKVEDSEFY